MKKVLTSTLSAIGITCWALSAPSAQAAGPGPWIAPPQVAQAYHQARWPQSMPYRGYGNHYQAHWPRGARPAMPMQTRFSPHRPMMQAPRPPMRAFHPMMQAQRPPMRASRPMTQAQRPPMRAFRPVMQTQRPQWRGYGPRLVVQAPIRQASHAPRIAQAPSRSAVQRSHAWSHTPVAYRRTQSTPLWRPYRG